MRRGADPGTGLQVQQEDTAVRRHAQNQLCLVRDPAKVVDHVPLNLVPTFTESDPASRARDIHCFMLAESGGCEGEDAIACTEADDVAAAISQLLLDGTVHGDVARDISAIDT